MSVAIKPTIDLDRAKEVVQRFQRESTKWLYGLDDAARILSWAFFTLLPYTDKLRQAKALRQPHLMFRGPTGTGKTLAYLVPVIASGKRVIISTGTKNLQEQLYHKDLPFLQKHIGRRLKVAYMKGRNNYLCRQKVYEAEGRPILDGLTEIDEFRVIHDWETHTQTGDRAELKTLPEDSKLWHKLDARRELCSGQKCEQFERCFLTRMHQQAAEADIIIVNHHLFFADLSLRESDYASIIPDYQAVIFDEAHEIEEVAGQHFGIQVSNYRFNELARDVQDAAFRKGFGSKPLDRALQTFRNHSEMFFALFDGREGRSSFRARGKFAQRHGDEYASLLNALEMLGTQLKRIKKQTDEMIPLERRVAELDKELRFLIEGDDERFVYWVERRGRGVFLQGGGRASHGHQPRPDPKHTARRHPGRSPAPDPSREHEQCLDELWLATQLCPGQGRHPQLLGCGRWERLRHRAGHRRPDGPAHLAVAPGGFGRFWFRRGPGR